MFIQDIKYNVINCHFYYCVFFVHRYVTAMLICFLTNQAGTQVAVFCVIQVLALAYVGFFRPFLYTALNTLVILGDLFVLINCSMLIYYLNLSTYSLTKITIHSGLFYLFIVLVYLLVFISLLYVLCEPTHKPIRVNTNQSQGSHIYADDLKKGPKDEFLES